MLYTVRVIWVYVTFIAFLHLVFLGTEKAVNAFFVLVAQSCLTLWDPMDCSLPGFPVHGILQARILEWVAISFSRASSPTQGLNLGLLHCWQILYYLSHQGSNVTVKNPAFRSQVRMCSFVFAAKSCDLQLPQPSTGVLLVTPVQFRKSKTVSQKSCPEMSVEADTACF